jgi:hypothetical protein
VEATQERLQTYITTQLTALLLHRSTHKPSKNQCLAREEARKHQVLPEGGVSKEQAGILVVRTKI